MSGYDLNHCPAETKLQVSNIKDFLMDNLSGNLAGVYVHGSMCLGSFQPSHSDLDIIVVTQTSLNAVERFALMKGFLELHKMPSPIELSILCLSELNPWRHPTPYEFHFSEYWRPKFEIIAEENDLDFWDFKEVYTDGDIACHVTLINQSGICIYGQAISEVFPPVPEKDFWDSIVWGVDYFSKLEDELIVTGILTLLRIWSYKEKKAILSKAHAGEWSIVRVPSQYRYIVQNAVDIYNGKDEIKHYDPSDVEGLKQFAIRQITDV